jgi:hypothetical protein
LEVQTYELWAESVTDKDITGFPVKENVLRFKTVYLAGRPPGPRVTAEICLSRVDGSGTARGVVEGYSFFVGTDPTPLYDFPGSYSGPTDTLAIVLSGPSTMSIYSAHSITFLLGVSNMFAYATATIFVHPVSLLERILSATVTAVRNVLGGLGRRPGGGQPGDRGSMTRSAVTQVAYDRQTGKILLMHDVVALRGVQLPSESALVRAAGQLVSRSGLSSEQVAFASVSENAIKAGTEYTIDVKTQRLVAQKERQLSAADSQSEEPRPGDESNRS